MIKVKLTLVEAACLHDLVSERQVEGSYYGNKQQYYAMLERLRIKLDYSTHAVQTKQT